MKSSQAKVSTSKVNAKLTKQFEDSVYVTYLVKMKEQVDTSAVSKQAMEKATIEKQTASATKLSVRNSVVSTLRETASRTQYTLESYLEKEVDKGNVKEYKSYFIVNSLAVTSTKEVMEQIALLPEVEKVLPNETRYLQKAEVSKEKASAAPSADLAKHRSRKMQQLPRTRQLQQRIIWQQKMSNGISIISMHPQFGREESMEQASSLPTWIVGLITIIQLFAANGEDSMHLVISLIQSLAGMIHIVTLPACG